MKDYTRFLVEKFHYKDSILYIYCRILYKKIETGEYYDEEIYHKKVFKFKNVKRFEFYLDEHYYIFYKEIDEMFKEIGVTYFSKVFYRSKKMKRIYIPTQFSTLIMIEFDDKKEWNYRKQFQ